MRNRDHGQPESSAAHELSIHDSTLQCCTSTGLPHACSLSETLNPGAAAGYTSSRLGSRLSVSCSSLLPIGSAPKPSLSVTSRAASILGLDTNN